MKVVCGPIEVLPKALDKDVIYFSLYNLRFSVVGQKAPGYVAFRWDKIIKKQGFYPDDTVWDFISICFSIYAADLSCVRSSSSDGWTRKIQLEIYLHNKKPWEKVKNKLEKTIRFLTGDFWEFTFFDGGMPPPKPKKLFDKIDNNADCIALLSGGMDSLIGGIDLVSDGYSPCFISQGAKGDTDKQIKFAQKLAPKLKHFQWKNPITRNKVEDSTRGRSIVFLAYALLAASSLKKWGKETVPVFIAENGFISLNTALTGSRLGSLSTKTTHPVFLNSIEEILNSVGINVKLIRNYQFATKGEMLKKCKNKILINSLINTTTSCGRYSRFAYTHCGRCVPCLVRRASYYHAKIEDKTKYFYTDLTADAARNDKHDDIQAVALAYVKYKKFGIESVIGGSLSFSSVDDRSKYVNVVKNGLEELGEFLKAKGVL